MNGPGSIIMQHSRIIDKCEKYIGVHGEDFKPVYLKRPNLIILIKDKQKYEMAKLWL
jgi:hypothetical protein